MITIFTDILPSTTALTGLFPNYNKLNYHTDYYGTA